MIIKGGGRGGNSPPPSSESGVLAPRLKSKREWKSFKSISTNWLELHGSAKPLNYYSPPIILHYDLVNVKWFSFTLRVSLIFYTVIIYTLRGMVSIYYSKFSPPKINYVPSPLNVITNGTETNHS